MSRFDDYMEMKLATGEEDEDGGDYTNNEGCLPTVLGLLIILGILSFLSKLF